MTPLLLLLAIAQPPEDPTRQVSPVAPARYPYRVSLLFDSIERTPGDAVTLSGLARDALNKAVTDRESGRSLWQREFVKILNLPLKDIEPRQFETVLKPIAEVLALHERSARATRADWSDYELALRKYGLTRPFGDPRDFSIGVQFFAIQARSHLKAGRPEDSLRSLRVGLSLVRHLGQCPGMLQHDEAAVAAEQLLDVLVEVQSHPACPSLAEALDLLPRPLVSIRPALDGERLILIGSLSRSDAIRLDPVGTLLDADALLRLAQARRTLIGYAGRSVEPAINRIQMGLEIQRADASARAALREAGYPEAVVKATPALNAALLHGLIVGEEMQSRMAEALALPYTLATERLAMIEREHPRGPAKPDEPALSPERAVIERCKQFLRPSRAVERRLDLIRVVEAIRLHGKMPAKLSELGHIPNDSLTGQPFDYFIDDGIATVASSQPGPGEGDAGAVQAVFKFRKQREAKP